MCADRQITKKSGSGVTIGDQTLEEWIDEEQSKEIVEELSAPNHSLYQKPAGKFPMISGKSGLVRMYTMREINKQHWKEKLMSIKNSSLSITQKMDLAIITVLLSGKEMAKREVKTEVIESMPEVTSQSFDRRWYHIIRATLLRKLIKTQDHLSYLTYRLETATLDLTPQELHVFVYRKWKNTEEVFKMHPVLRSYFDEDDLNSPVYTRKLSKHKAPKPVDRDVKVEEVKVDEVEPPKARKTEIISTIEEAVSKALGVDVNINGRIEIVFKLGG